MRLLLAAVACCGLVLPVVAQPTDSVATPVAQRLVAAVHEAPPFAIKNDDGTWDGIAVELWREIGRAEGFEAALDEVPDGGVLDAVASGRADVGLTAPASAEAERRVDFTLPYYTATLGIAEPRADGAWAVAKRLFSPTFLKFALGIAVLLLLVGVIAWLVERSDNEDDFRQSIGGVWDGFYWAGVTMSTIGYGDKAPKTTGGRALALVWMLISMAVTAALTAALVSALGLKSGSASASLPADVRGQTVGVVERTVAADFLDAERVRVRPFPTLAAALDALDRDSIDVVVDATPVLENAISERGMQSLKVSATKAEPQQWALAVPAGSPLRERFSRAVLERIDGPAWQATLDRYLQGAR
ncbi:MAG: transporter substrate-binding domain-containing protein [Rhodothermales bacterium]